MTQNNLKQNKVFAESLIAELRESYIHGLQGKFNQLENYILKMEQPSQFLENFQALYRETHSLKGSAGTYGIHAISAICHQLEDQLTLLDQNHGQIQQQITDDLLAYVDLMRTALESFGEAKAQQYAIEHQLAALKIKTNNKKFYGLIVENSRLHAQICLGALEQYPIQLSTAEDGLTALQRLLRERFDFLISGVEINSLNGPALLAATKLSQSVNKNIKTILLTSRTQPKLINTLQPDIIVAKNADMPANITKAVTCLLNL